jgi:hypothetical protein
VVVPAATAVTTPVPGSTVATAVSDDVHAVGVAAVVVAERPEVEPTQADKVPEITGIGFTVIVLVAVAVQPLVVAVTV